MTYKLEPIIHTSSLLAKKFAAALGKPDSQITSLSNYMDNIFLKKHNGKKEFKKLSRSYTCEYSVSLNGVDAKFDIVFLYKRKRISDFAVEVTLGKKKFKLVFETDSHYDSDLEFDKIFNQQSYAINKMLSNTAGAFDTDHFDFGGDKDCLLYIRASENWQDKASLNKCLTKFFECQFVNCSRDPDFDFKKHASSGSVSDIIDKRVFLGITSKKKKDQALVDANLIGAYERWRSSLEKELEEHKKSNRDEFVGNLIWVGVAVAGLIWLLS